MLKAGFYGLLSHDHRGNILLWVGEIEDQPLAKPQGRSRMSAGLNEPMRELMAKSGFENRFTSKDVQRLEADHRASGEGGDPAGLPGRVTVGIERWIKLELSLRVELPSQL